MRRQVRQVHASCLSPHQGYRPPKPGTTHLRAKGKLTTDAAEKFRGLSKGLLPAEKAGG